MSVQRLAERLLEAGVLRKGPELTEAQFSLAKRLLETQIPEELRALFRPLT